MSSKSIDGLVQLKTVDNQSLDLLVKSAVENSVIENITVNEFKLPTDAQDGYVLTSDADGNGEWKEIDTSNIYNSDGTLTTDRAINCGQKNLIISDCNDLTLDVSGDFKIALPTALPNRFLKCISPNGEAEWASMVTTVIEGDYGSASKIPLLSINAEGRVTSASDVDLVTSSIYDSDGTLTGNRVVNGNGNTLTINAVTNFQDILNIGGYRITSQPGLFVIAPQTSDFSTIPFGFLNESEFISEISNITLSANTFTISLPSNGAGRFLRYEPGGNCVWADLPSTLSGTQFTSSSDGTAAEPTFKVGTSGMYQSSSGTLALSANGNQVMTLSSGSGTINVARPIINTSGNASNCMYCVANSQSTGMFGGAGGSVAFSVAGTSKLELGAASTVINNTNMTLVIGTSQAANRYLRCTTAGGSCTWTAFPDVSVGSSNLTKSGTLVGANLSLDLANTVSISGPITAAGVNSAVFYEDSPRISGTQGGYYFNSSANLGLDLSGNNRNGTNVGALQVLNDPTRNTVISITNNGQYIDLPVANFRTFTNFALSIWVKFIDMTQERTLFAASDGSTNAWFFLNYNTSNQVAYLLKFGGVDQVLALFTIALNDGNWHHIFVQTGTNGNRLWVDGVQRTPTYNAGSAASTTSLAAINASSTLTVMRVGNDTITGNIFNPNFFIDSVELFNKALTSEEIVDLANTSTGRSVESPNLRITNSTRGFNKILTSDASGNITCIDYPRYFELFWTGNATASDVTVANTFVQINATPTVGINNCPNEITISGASFTWIGAPTLNFHIDCQYTISAAAPAAFTYIVAIFKNGTIITQSSSRLYFPVNQPLSVDCQALVSLATNDVISFRITNVSSSVQDPIVQQASIIISSF